ncbi:unnamed protein product [Brachionus calyciflorus]|uniref:Ctf8 n=1 Tax=Brachionus calyciflorus TaxID=104777 RepID=A0A813WPC8_9BILA|nr:unnamed protein product [Brachionus calyciflorus]
MVQIYIKLSEDKEVNEWAIIELQGDLECEKGESICGKFMADLHFNKDGTPILILGHHVMHGKVSNLDKPMVLIKKFKEKLDNPNVDEQMQVDDALEQKFKTEYIVQAIIRKKILFNKRPKPIVF